MRDVIDALIRGERPDKETLTRLLTHFSADDAAYAAEAARETAEAVFGKRIFIRGLIEISSICKNDCLYCGLRRSNKNAERYRLSEAQVLDCCASGYRAGFRTFVLQGGEDAFFTDDVLCGIVQRIKSRYPDCAVTLSMGERSRSSYAALRQAGADRYLLRHETASPRHYGQLHPPQMSYDNRMRCLRDLKNLGFQTGCGFMVGSPFQTADDLAEDLLFIQKFQPHMVGIGPFIPHCDTPFRDYPSGSCDLTLFLLSLIRITQKNVLLPATTALGTLLEDGRERGILSGANVIMPNLSPVEVRCKYKLYDNKLCTGDETAEQLEKLKKRIAKIGYEIVTDRGDYNNCK